MVPSAPFKHLQPGRRYVVSVAFHDYDGALHPEGESWIFRGHSFLPYDDGLSLFVAPTEEALRHIRLQWRPEAQAEVIDNLERFIAPVG